ncbi:hypothetical protein D3C87_1678010 [compost metagenome]
MVPITGKTKRENNVSSELNQKRLIKVLININGALINSTKLPKIFPSTSPTSFDIRDIISPFLLSVKNETGKDKTLRYISPLRSLVTPTR